jgi:RNA polymerase sigma-70 factor (sigma-E family)
VDEDGFRAFVHSRLGRWSRVAYLLTGDHHAAEDLLQNALVKLAARWDRVSAVGEPDAYLRAVLYHEHVSLWRRSRHRRVERPMESPPERGGPDESEDTIRRLVVQQALVRLPARQRAVIVLRYFEDLSEADTATVLGCSVGAVKSHTHRAMRQLRLDGAAREVASWTR